MPITWTCACGKPLRVADEYAGLWVKCPACNGVALAPCAEPILEVVEDNNQVSPLAPPPPKPAIIRPRHRETIGDEDDLPRQQSNAVVEDERTRIKRGDHEDDEDERVTHKSCDDNDDDEDRPKKKRRKKDKNNEEVWPESNRRSEEVSERPWEKQGKKTEQNDRDDHGHSGLEHRILNGGVLGGFAAMAIAVVWFVVGLMAGWIFYYPPVLFVVGLIAVIRGGLNSSE